MTDKSRGDWLANRQSQLLRRHWGITGSDTGRRCQLSPESIARDRGSGDRARDSAESRARSGKSVEHGDRENYNVPIDWNRVSERRGWSGERSVSSRWAVVEELTAARSKNPGDPAVSPGDGIVRCDLCPAGRKNQLRN